jgi:UDPglucose--hexose-1-phosphate uridylyltransferase
VSTDHSHSRRNLLTGEWVLVSPHRTQRPWQGQLEAKAPPADKPFDPACFLCPGNSRASGRKNPAYRGSFVFDNDFSALSAASIVQQADDALFQLRPESGCCRVVCYSERHDLSLSTMHVDDIVTALTAIRQEFHDLDRSGAFQYVQIFENRGQMMGCSNQHPHAQIWATENLPNEPAKELVAQREYFAEHDACLLLDYLRAELRAKDRIITANDYFVALLPYWAVWPFETLILPQRHIDAPDEMTGDEVRGLALVLKTVLSAYDRMFGVSAPYSMGFHPRPSDGKAHPEWLLHLHIYPPLLRSATVRKHLVGFEMLGMPQRDLTPEVAAAKLRAALSPADPPTKRKKKP